MKNKITKIVSGIFVGIIATAIWEKLLSPYFDIWINYILSFGNRFIILISNVIYCRIAKGTYINIPYYIFMIIMCSFIGAGISQTYIAHISHRNSNGKNIDKNNIFKKIINNSKFDFYFNILLVSFCTIFYLVFLLMTNFINNSITKVTNNIEIVSPYIEDNEYKMLKSKFYSMTSREDYEELIFILDEYENEFDITLK